MRKIVLIGLLIVSCCLAQAQIRKSNLRVLYVGGSDNQHSVLDRLVDSAEVKIRMASFEQMLKKYFKTVKVVHAGDYRYPMSEEYDVTVMDGVPEQTAPAERGLHQRSGRMIITKAAGYFPEDFDRPVLLIAEMGETLGRRIGLKTDWYCLCLDADAHHFRAEHPIFNKPFPVKMTIRMKPTPSDAFHYAYYTDEPIPDSIPMWQVQTKGYKTDEGFRVGMVSRPWGFEDSFDAEYISSGVCAKTLDAVAIGRHGNFLHWGFAASPADMTEEAQAVLANAIVYISQFAGQTPVVRKYEANIATREYIKEVRYLATRTAWQESEKMQREFEQPSLEKKAKAQAKQARGEKLTDEEAMYLDYEPMEPRSYADFLKWYQEGLFDRFGEDESAYLRYYDDNRDYFYGGEGAYNLVVDEDVKSLGIPNNDLRLLDAAISLLEKEQEVEKANRILTRYTLCRFTTPQEWRDWYETNKSRLFFTEAGGWLFMVNTRETVPGNDYHIRDAKPETAALPQVGATDHENPVQLAIGLNTLANGNREIVLRFRIHAGYHIYAHVSEADPYIPTTVEMKLPDGYRGVGKLKRSSFKGFNDSGTTVYEQEAVFRQEIAGSGSGEVVCTVGYQCCDSQICMPPVKKEMKVEIR